MLSMERSELRGTILDGRYRVGASIGTGGTGVVFEAERLATLETVVVKTLRPVYAGYPDLVRRLRREVEVSHRVFHPGIVPILDEGQLDDESPYVVMKYIRAESLCAYLRRTGVMSSEEVAIVATRIASILHSVHAKGYVHRDIKPEHVMLNRSTTGDLDVFLLDFGVCAARTAPQDEKRRERGRVFGTPSYSSPEQASGSADVDGRADLFGLGITLFEALSGRLPFTGTDVNAILRRIIREDAPRLGLVAMHVDDAMDQVVMRLLARNPEGRFANARTVMREFMPFIDDRREAERAFAARLQVGQDAPSIRPTVQHDIVAA